MQVRRVVTGHTSDGKTTIANDSSTDLDNIDFEQALVEVEGKLPGMSAHMEPDNPGMSHTQVLKKIRALSKLESSYVASSTHLSPHLVPIVIHIT